MLDHYKTVLERVSFDSVKFRKELRKAFKNLVDDEQLLLKDWLNNSTFL